MVLYDQYASREDALLTDSGAVHIVLAHLEIGPYHLVLNIKKKIPTLVEPYF